MHRAQCLQLPRTPWLASLISIVKENTGQFMHCLAGTSVLSGMEASTAFPDSKWQERIFGRAGDIDYCCRTFPDV